MPETQFRVLPLFKYPESPEISNPERLEPHELEEVLNRLAVEYESVIPLMEVSGLRGVHPARRIRNMYSNDDTYDDNQSPLKALIVKVTLLDEEQGEAEGK